LARPEVGQEDRSGHDDARDVSQGLPLDAKESAAGASRNLADYKGNKVALMKLGTEPNLLKLLEEGTPAAKEQAAWAISNLADNDDNKVTLMTQGAGPTLSKLLEEDTSDAIRLPVPTLGDDSARVYFSTLAYLLGFKFDPSRTQAETFELPLWATSRIFHKYRHMIL
jgi:hypothetical protein